MSIKLSILLKVHGARTNILAKCYLIPKFYICSFWQRYCSNDCRSFQGYIWSDMLEVGRCGLYLLRLIYSLTTRYNQLMFSHWLSHLRVPGNVANELQFTENLCLYPGLSCARLGMVPTEDGHEGDEEDKRGTPGIQIFFLIHWGDLFLFSDKVT